MRYVAVVAVAALAVMGAHPVSAGHKGTPHGGGGGDKTTLHDLSCTTDQIAKYDGSAWVCTDLFVPRGVKFVFASSTLSDGDLGGLEGADTQCNVLAANVGLPGEFVAWLSTDSVNAVDRLAGSDGPWFNTNGEMVATSLADLTRGDINNPIDFDEDGIGPLTPTENVEVWTGTLGDGTGGGAYCLGWTSGSAEDSGVRAKIDRSDLGWTDLGASPCDSLAGSVIFDKRIYCFER